MSMFDYKYSQSLSVDNPPFYALIMAAMRQADSANMVKLELAFPDIADELRRRYDAPGGILAESERAEAERWHADQS